MLEGQVLQLVFSCMASCIQAIEVLAFAIAGLCTSARPQECILVPSDVAAAENTHTMNASKQAKESPLCEAS